MRALVTPERMDTPSHLPHEPPPRPEQAGVGMAATERQGDLRVGGDTLPSSPQVSSLEEHRRDVVLQAVSSNAVSSPVKLALVLEPLPLLPGGEACLLDMHAVGVGTRRSPWNLAVL